MRRRTLLAALAVAPALPALAQTPTPGDRPRVTIKAVDAFALKGLVLVRVTASDGTAGWGEAGHSGGKLVARLVRDELAALCLGRDPFEGDALWWRMYVEIDELGPGGLASQALAGVDCALWDLRGRLVGQPVWALLGGKYRARFPVYGSFSIDKGGGARMTPVEAARRAGELVGEGFRHIKVRMAIREENADPDPDPTFPVAAAVRRAVGPAVPLYVDANNGYRPARAIQMARRLAGDLNVEVFEEPVAMHHYASLRQVSDAAPLTIAAGEHEYTPWAFRDLIEQGRPGLLNPDVSKLSGLTAGRKVAALAELTDTPISVHNARPTLLTAAHAHFVAAAPTATRPQEHPGAKRLSEQWRFFRNRLLPEGGFFTVPDTPGLGLEVDAAAVEAAAG